ncbi:hypothetical protein J2W32_006501 [Variovorax boronicumulans]|uniref:Uncharacterized protein n=1 Tax=Variovorax boronicumulans TaxID=436515 RepID=A0AAW8DBI2_9BURK|nr:hypothetical protein [Variovorax boronicumulans]MDQ0057424.1 hypothetical protein [Variovorax boronicumulans]
MFTAGYASVKYFVPKALPLKPELRFSHAKTLSFPGRLRLTFRMRKVS